MQQQEKVFPNPPAIPVFTALDGVTYDFNNGVRVRFEKPENCGYVCRLTDTNSGRIVFSSEITADDEHKDQPVFVTSNKKFYVPWKVEIFKKEDLSSPVFAHTMDLKEQTVLVNIPVKTLGDSIAWFSYVERFMNQNGCSVYVSMMPEMIEIFKNQYPDINFVTQDEAEKLTPYATYNLGLFFKGDTDHQPYDFRQIGLHRTAGAILGVKDLSDIPPRVDLSAQRQIKEKYVVIATQASSQCKYWNNATGWDEVVSYLKAKGYRVICIDKDDICGCNWKANRMPAGAENFTGNKPLQERINIIKDADCFIGLSSGLSWLAWCCKVPVVMISGFTDPLNEFNTPYRVIDTTVCHGCWNDTRCDFDHYDYLWCPRKEKAIEKFECTFNITAKMVLDKVMEALR